MNQRRKRSIKSWPKFCEFWDTVKGSESREYRRYWALALTPALSCLIIAFNYVETFHGKTKKYFALLIYLISKKVSMDLIYLRWLLSFSFVRCYFKFQLLKLTSHWFWSIRKTRSVIDSWRRLTWANWEKMASSISNMSQSFSLTIRWMVIE